MLDFLKRGGRRGAAPLPAPPERTAVVTDHMASVQYRAKSGTGVRLSGRPDPAELLPAMLDGIAMGDVEVVEPRAVEFSDAVPALERPHDAKQWLEAHEGHGPIARHAVLVLESVGAADLAIDAVACALLHGDLDMNGYPEEDAVVGGYASRWDEEHGDLIVRPVVAWGGRGLRGDTERHAHHLVVRLHQRLVAQAADAAGGGAGRRAEVDEADRHTCPHCGFELTSPGAMFCPKCGMRIERV